MIYNRYYKYNIVNIFFKLCNFFEITNIKHKSQKFQTQITWIDLKTKTDSKFL